MSSRQRLLLLLALGAVTLGPQLTHAAYLFQWDESWRPGYIGKFAPVTGRLLSTDAACPVEDPFCKPVPDVTVTAFLEDGSVGELFPDTRPRSPPIGRSSSSGKPGTAQPLDNPAYITTDATGTFVVYASSSIEGDSNINATVTLNDTTIAIDSIATVSWQQPAYTVYVDAERTYDTVGLNQTITATLLLGQPPSRKAASKGKAALNRFVMPPVPGATITFLRADTPFEAPQKTRPATAHPRVVQEAVEFGSAITGPNGHAVITLTFPPAPGYTAVTARFVDAANVTWEGSTTVEYYSPVPKPNITAGNTTTTPGQDLVVTVTVTDDQGAPRPEVDVTFDIVEPNVTHRQAPRTRDASTTKPTDSQGQASITLRQDTPGDSVLTASYVDNGRVITSDPIHLSWAAPPADFTTILLMPARQEVPVRTPARLTAVVLDAAEQPVENVTVKFNVTAVTNRTNAGPSQQAHKEEEEPVTVEVASVGRQAVSDEDGKARIVLQSFLPGLWSVVASAINSAGALVSSSPVSVRFVPNHHDDYPGHDDYYPKHKHHKHEEYDRPDKEEHHRDHKGEHSKAKYDRPAEHHKHEEYDRPAEHHPRSGYGYQKPPHREEQYNHQKPHYREDEYSRQQPRYREEDYARDNKKHGHRAGRPGGDY